MCPQPHGPLQQLEENLWVVEGTLKRLPFGRKMTVVKLASGGLLVHSAVLLDEAVRTTFDALGNVEMIVVPNRFHDIDGGRMKGLYPNARLVALPATARAVAKKFPLLEPIEPDAAPHSVKFARIPGLKNDEFVLEVPSAKGTTLVFTDAMFNVPHGRGVQGFVQRIAGMTGGLKMTPIGRAGLLRDKATFANWLREQAARDDVRRVVVAHGIIVDEKPGERLREAADRL